MHMCGQPVTDEMIQDWADEAESGFELETLRRRGRPTVGDGPGAIVPARMDAELLATLNARAKQERATPVGGHPRSRAQLDTRHVKVHASAFKHGISPGASTHAVAYHLYSAPLDDATPAREFRLVITAGHARPGALVETDTVATMPE